MKPKPVDAVQVAREARLAERERIRAILDHPEAERRRRLAMHCAFEAPWPPAEEAIGIMAASNKEPAAPTNRLALVMGTIANPIVGADADPPSGPRPAA